MLDRPPNMYREDMDEDAAPTATIAVGGAFFCVKAGKCYREEVLGGKRGEITQFSSASRRRLMRLMAQVDRTACRRKPLFITLTYPREYPTSSTVYKSHLRRFLLAFGRRYPHTPIIWRLEYQERGAPHYHLMVFTPWFISWRWVAKAWYEATGRADYLTLVAGTETRAVRSWRGVMSYAAKYMSKSKPLPEGQRPGRLWGVHCRKDLPIRLHVIQLDWSHFGALQAWLWEWHAGQGREVLHRYRTKGASAYMPNNLAYSMVQRALLCLGASYASCIEPFNGQ
jgi:hypothetical protein